MRFEAAGREKRKLKICVWITHFFFRSQSGWHFWGEIMGKGAENERGKGAIYDMRTALCIVKTHKMWIAKCVLKLFFVYKFLLFLSTVIKMQLPMEAFNLVCKQSFKSSLSPKFLSSFSNCAYYAEVFFLYALRFFHLIHQILSAMQEKKARIKSVRQELCKKGRNKRKHCEMQFFPALKFILLKGALQEYVEIFYYKFEFEVQFSFRMPKYKIEFYISL